MTKMVEWFFVQGGTATDMFMFMNHCGMKILTNDGDLLEGEALRLFLEEVFNAIIIH